MNIVINFDEINLADYIDIENLENPDIPSLKEVFKQEILYHFVQKLNVDNEIKKYVQENLRKSIDLDHNISKYRDEIVIKNMVNDIIEKKLKNRGDFILINQSKTQIEEQVNSLFDSIDSEIKKSIKTSLTYAIKKIINQLYVGSTIERFVDKEKLSKYIYEILEKENLIKGR